MKRSETSGNKEIRPEISDPHERFAAWILFQVFLMEQPGFCQFGEE
jgi:hypothetical protein